MNKYIKSIKLGIWFVIILLSTGFFFNAFTNNGSLGEVFILSSPIGFLSGLVVGLYLPSKIKKQEEDKKHGRKK